MTAKTTYPVDVISKLLDLTPRRVQHLANEGVIPRAEKGRYELVPAVRGYIRYLRDRSVGRDGVVIPDIASERARLTREQADRVAMENAKARGDLIPGLLVQKSIERVFAAFKARIEAVPRKAVPRLKGATKDAAREAILRELNRDALNELAAFDFAGIIRGVGEGLSIGGNGAEAPAGPDSEPVGGRVSRPVPGEQRGAREVEHVEG